MAIDRLVPQAHRGAKGFGGQAVLAVDICCQRGSGGLTTHVIGTLENVDPSPSDWVEPEGPMESFGFEDWPGVGVVYAS
jgi:hypothetical protein